MICRFLILVALLVLFAPAIGSTQDLKDADLLPRDAISIATALDTVAARYRGRALAATVKRPKDHEVGETAVYEFRWLTPAGNVLKIRLSTRDARFLEVDGLGQTEARILP